MNWLYVIGGWIAVSFAVSPFIGRGIRFGMTGKLNPPVERASVSAEIVALR